jgi:hypothetical protein
MPDINGSDSIQRLLVLRKLTRAVADALRAQMLEYLATLTPLLRPKVVLGDYIQGGQKEPARRADKAFKELQSLYEAVATAKPYSLPRDLSSPIDVPSLSLEITPLDYQHRAMSGGESKTISVRSPLTWVLSYSGCAPARLSELLASKNRGSDLQQCVLSYLAMHVVATHQTGVAQMLDAVHFPLSTAKMPEFGDLPITRIGAAISTSRPSDEMIVQSAELTGMDAFEEIVDVDDIPNLRDPLKERLLEIMRTQAPELVVSSPARSA